MLDFGDFLQKLQNKPYYIRVQILCLSVAVCMFVIVFFWVISLKHSLVLEPKKSENKEEKSQLSEKIRNLLSIKDSFKASLSSFFDFFSKNNLETKTEFLPDNFQKSEAKQEIKGGKLPTR